MSGSEPEPESARHVYHRGFPLDDKTRPSLFHRLMRTTGFRIFWVLFIIAFSTVPVTFLTIYVFSLGILGIVGHRKLRTFSDWSIRSWLNSMSVSDLTDFINTMTILMYNILNIDLQYSINLCASLSIKLLLYCLMSNDKLVYHC